jgi:hypothetical protein
MQELFENLGQHARSLAEPAALLQIAGIAIAVGLAWWVARLLRSSAPARGARLRPGLQGRLAEALLIVSPLIVAMLLTAAFGGFLHAF